MLRLLTLTLALFPVFLFAQTIKGTLTDAQSELPLIGATVELISTAPARGTVTDIDGRFALNELPVGRHTLRLSYLGYESQTVGNLLVNAGKDLIVELQLTEAINELDVVTVTAGIDPAGANNELSTVSVRQLTSEQVNRFAGGRADISRLASNLAGVATSNDSRNDIVIRGNSPTGLLWQLEGIPIPNPNHFSTLGTTGGPVSALNPNLLGNSDFVTSAFGAEYGDALAGVFDLQLRRGNADRHEFMLQTGSFSGLEALAEGPLGKPGGSFVVGFRNSFIGLADALGVPVGTGATPDYRDLTFNLDFANGAAGKFSIFGIAATSRIDFLADEIDESDLFADGTRNSYPRSRFGVLGLRHNKLVGKQSYVRTVLSASLQSGIYTEFDVDGEFNNALQLTDVDDRTLRYSVKSYYNSKINNRLTLRTGLQADLTDLRTQVADRIGSPDLNGDGLPDLLPIRDFDGRFGLLQVFGQARYRLDERLTFNGGLHLQYFTLSEAFALEPRLALRYRANGALELTLGYGQHSQTPALPVFFFRDAVSGTPDANQGLGFQRARHFVLGSDWSFAPNWRLKTELYYQRLRDIPVDNFSSSFSLLNAGADFVFPERANLVNEGTGRNYGAELTLEHFFAQNWYFLATASVFESTYVASDGVRRPTAFDNRYVTNLLAGKEWPFGEDKRHRFMVNTKLAVSGGRPYTPVDLTASRALGTDVRNESLAFTEVYAGYFRWDLKVGYQLNSKTKKISQGFFVDLQNLTNRENIFQERFNPATGNVNTVFQSGFFPDIQYRIQF